MNNMSSDAFKTIDKLDDIQKKHIASWVQFSLREEADKFVPFVRLNYLQGQKLRRITGRTASSIKAWTPKKGTIKKHGLTKGVFIRPGVGIAGNLNYLGKWVNTEREFMRPALLRFRTGGRVENAVRKNIDKMLDEVLDEK